MDWIQLFFSFLCSVLRDRTELAAENLALRRQLTLIQRKSPCCSL